MTKSEPKYRRPLNTHQILLLNTLYKFRFATAALIAESQGAKHIRVITSRLKILVDQKYLGMNYTSSYKIQGKPATYYLTTKAVRYLREQPYTDESNLRSIYHDKRAKPGQIQHRLHVFNVYNYFKHTYKGLFKFYSKTETRSMDYLPKQRPDGYLVDTTSDKKYFLDCLEDTMTYWTLRKTIKRYIYYFEHEIWQKTQDSPVPSVLIVCESEQLRRKIRNVIKKELDSTYAVIDFLIRTDTSLKTDAKDKWTNPVDPDKLFGL